MPTPTDTQTSTIPKTTPPKMRALLLHTAPHAPHAAPPSQPSHTAILSHTTPTPTPCLPTDLLIRVGHVALNPVDALYTFHPLGETGRVVGSDFEGRVVQVGPGFGGSRGMEAADELGAGMRAGIGAVMEEGTGSGTGAERGTGPEGGRRGSSTGVGTAGAGTEIKVGDRVAGFVQGACSANPRPGAFAEYVVCPADLVWRVPEGTMEEHGQAAAVSLCALTAAQALFWRLGLTAPFSFEGKGGYHEGGSEDDKETLRFFVYGASTSVGMYAAQLLRRSCEASGQKLLLIGAASRGRWELLRAPPYGYDGLVDYRDPDWPEQVRRLTGGAGVDAAYDCISEGDTVERVAGTLNANGRMAIVRSRAGGAWAAAGGELPTEPIYGAVWEGLGVEIQYQGFTVPASEAARRFAVAFYGWLSAGGRLEANPIRLMPGGLDRVVEDGFALLGSGTMDARHRERREEWMRPISAEKLVYQVRG